MVALGFEGFRVSRVQTARGGIDARPGLLV